MSAPEVGWCYNCGYLKEVVTLWCMCDDAAEKHLTRIPEIAQEFNCPCEYWKPIQPTLWKRIKFRLFGERIEI